MLCSADYLARRREERKDKRQRGGGKNPESQIAAAAAVQEQQWQQQQLPSPRLPSASCFLPSGEAFRRPPCISSVEEHPERTISATPLLEKAFTQVGRGLVTIGTPGKSNKKQSYHAVRDPRGKKRKQRGSACIRAWQTNFSESSSTKHGRHESSRVPVPSCPWLFLPAPKKKRDRKRAVPCLSVVVCQVSWAGVCGSLRVVSIHGCSENGAQKDLVA